MEFLVDLPRENGKIVEYLVGTLPVLKRTAFLMRGGPGFDLPKFLEMGDRSIHVQEAETLG